MGKAFRSDVLETPQIASETAALEAREDILPSETVNCPIDGCGVQYVIYNYLFSDAHANLSTLMYGLRIHHPDHQQQKFVLNEPNAQ